VTSADARSDAELMRAHVAGDPDAFSELFTRHRDRLWAVALRTLGDPEEAADALQDALISAFRRADTFRGDALFTTWMHRIVVNSCLDRVRRRKARPADPLPEDGDRVTALAEPAVDVAEAMERRTDVLAALAQLADEQRAALVLVDMEGYSVDEAAELLGCAPGTVKSRCSRGRAKLAPLLSQYRSTRPDEAAPAVGRNRTPPAGVVPATPDPVPPGPVPPDTVPRGEAVSGPDAGGDG
jgi:RNA polymerase sigma factor (sigma-70 family)